jgi:hypothetical protein
MSLYLVLVDIDLKRLPGVEPALPRVVAHNLTREMAERLEVELANNSVEGQPTGWKPASLGMHGFSRTDGNRELLGVQGNSPTALQASSSASTAGKSKKVSDVIATRIGGDSPTTRHTFIVQPAVKWSARRQARFQEISALGCNILL